MTINCKGQLIDLSTPKVMGILNITPDSLYDGGLHKTEKGILLHTEKMLTEGVTFIDIGAYSSRPNSEHISETEELRRILPIVELLVTRFPEINISIDTFRSTVAKQCIEVGAAIINDISAGQMDNNMMETVANLGVPYIMMHMKGTPQNMQQHTNYSNLVKEMIFYFSESIAKARAHKINTIIIDPGFGFSKNLEQNYELLSKLELFKNLDLPILVGVSRKSMIYKLLDSTPQKALNGTAVINTIALIKGANILRVHDVKEAIECIKITHQMN